MSVPHYLVEITNALPSSWYVYGSENAKEGCRYIYVLGPERPRPHSRHAFATITVTANKVTIKRETYCELQKDYDDIVRVVRSVSKLPVEEQFGK